MRGAITVGLLGGLLASAVARGGVVYTITDLGDLGGNDSVAHGLNGSARVVGAAQTAAGVDHAFRHSGATMTELNSITDCDDFCRAEGRAINVNDHVAGWADFPPMFKNAVYWTGGTAVRVITKPLPYVGESAAYDLTDDSDLRIVGGADIDELPVVRHAFRWTDTNDSGNVDPGEWENLGVVDDVNDPALCPGCSSEARGVNAAGDVVGWSDICDCVVPGGPSLRQAFFWENGVMQGLATSWGSSEAFAVNDSDIVVGWRHDSNIEQRASRWDVNSGTANLGVLPGDNASSALDINNCNQIVGWSGDGVGQRAVIWQKPDFWQIADLNDLIDPSLGWTLQVATGINENGDISGYGTRNGNTRGFLLRPTWARLAVDPICPCSYDEDGTDCDDSECSDDLLHFSSITSDVTRLADGGRPAIGMAADGVSRVVLRVEVPGPGTVDFEVGDDLGSPTSPDRGGNLWTIDGVNSFTNLDGVEVESIGDGRYMAFAIHISPLNFVRDHPAVDDENAAWRPLYVTIDYTPVCGSNPSPAQLVLELHRPPVALLHGWHGKASSFKWPLRTDPRLTVFAHNYSRSNTAAWSENLGLSGGDNQPKAAARNAIFKLREQGIAAVQVDIVAHSMGGVLSRLHAADVAGDYTEPYNYGQGDFHKLVTVDTPHLGMSLTCLLGTTCGCIAEMIVGRPDGAMLDFSLQGTFAQSVGGSIPAVNSVPCHVIVGETGNNIVNDMDNICGPDWISYVPGASILGWLHDQCTEFIEQYRNMMLNEEHDMFVPVSSQRARLTSNAITPIDRPDFADLAGTHIGVNEDAEVSDVVVGLLQTDAVIGPDWQNLLSVTTGNLPICGDWCFIDSDLCDESPGLLDLQMVAPADVEAGGDIGIQLTADFSPTSVLLWSEDGRRWFNRDHCLTYDCSLLNTDLPAPDDAFGPMVISAIAYDDDFLMDGARATDVIVNIVPPLATTLDSLRVEPDRTYLHDFADDYLVDIVGTFSDGVDRVMSGSIRGTIYSSANPAIAGIDCDGVVVAHAVGETTITANNIYDAGLETALGTVRVVSTGPNPPPPPVFADCNTNGLDDSCEIAAGFVDDLDQDGVPDVCACPQDCGDQNGIIGIIDFLTLLAQWGQSDTSCDFDGGGVGINDFLDLLANWGPCS